jgi:hypothetical protein
MFGTRLTNYSNPRKVNPKDRRHGMTEKARAREERWT